MEQPPDMRELLRKYDMRELLRKYPGDLPSAATALETIARVNPGMLQYCLEFALVMGVCAAETRVDRLSRYVIPSR